MDSVVWCGVMSVQEVLAARASRGAGSRAYVVQILRALVDACDAQRLEVRAPLASRYNSSSLAGLAGRFSHR